MARRGSLEFIAKATVAAFLMITVAPVCSGQTVTGAIGGTVTDASGALVPNVNVTVTNTGTAVQLKTVTSQAGDYRVPFLAVGTYSVRIEAPGFKVFLREGLILRVDEVLHVDAKLEVGSVQEQVTISGAAPMLDTENASTGNVIENERIETLPLNGRNFLQLAQLTADVNAGSWGGYNRNQSLNPAEKGVSLSADGQRDPSTLFLVDGANVRGGYFGTITIVPSIDSIQEFEMQTSSFTAQFGTSPVFVNVATKSGTNIPHGSLYEFDREAFLNAQNFFVTPATAYLPWHQHNFGGSIGGPIILPHLFNGKDKTFFFFSYEGQRIISKSPSTMSVPPAAYRNGDFSSLLPGTVVKDPLTGTAFSGNIIPSNRIAAYAPFVINYWPLPARSGLVNNYTVGTPTISGDDQYLARIDHQLGSNDHLYGRWAETSPLYHTSVAGTGGNPNFAGVFTQAGQNVLVGETHGFGPQTVNEFRFAYNGSLFQASGISAVNLASQLNWGGVTETIGMPVVTVNGTNASFNNLADQTPGGYNQETYQFSDNLSMHRGKHTITFGEDIFDMRSTINVPGGFQPPFPRATATFNGTFSGNAFADFLLGFPISGNQTINKAGYVSPAMNYSYPDFNFYGQDDWKISRKFTFNIGLRYELVPVLQNPGMRNFDFQAGQLSTQGAVAAFYNGAHKDFAPRVGFAWQPFEGGKTVVRAGYGWYYARAVSYGPAKLANNPPAQTVASFTNAGISAANAVTMTSFVTNANPAVTQGGILWAIDPNFTPTPSTQIRSFDIQHQLPAGFLVDVGYKGSLTTHQDGLVDQNTAPPGPGSVNPRRPFPAYATIDDIMSVFNASYNAGIVRVEKRMGKGLSMLSSYSYSKCIDEVGTPDGNSEETDGTLGAQNRFDIAAEKGLCGMHMLHRAIFSYIYQLPFGRGKALLNSNAVLDKFVGGWVLSGITTFQSGGTHSVQDNVDIANSGAQFERPDAYCNPNLPTTQRSIKAWFNTACFGNLNLDPPYRYGTAGRSLIYNPGTNNFDLTLMKNTAVNERLTFQFRAEAFNAFNHTPLGNPNGSMGGTFGVISSAGNPRQVQLALKMLF